KAAEVAAHRGERECLGTGKKMVERYFFDGVHVPGARIAVDPGVEGSALILPDAADTPLPLGDEAVVPAEEAGYLLSVTLLVERSLFHRQPASWAAFSPRPLPVRSGT